MRNAAREQEMPIQPHKLTPEVADSFWVNLIGRGYPAPSQKFRWCTERLKIKPSNKFIRGVVQKYGEAILVLGTRKAESQRRAANIEKHAARRVRERLVPNASLPNSLVYTPIEDWNNDDVWLYLMQVKNPWGHDNKSLLGMYQGATEGGECPLVVDSSTPSCGSSRFGCWVCTVVDKDRSMEAMIKNDEEKVWMTPLLELRNELDEPDRDKRDFRRMNGHVQLFHDRTVPGPYKKEAREHWLRRVLEAQQSARQNGPEEFREIQLITLEELDEIRRLWLHEKHEFDDSLPRIYEEVTGESFPKPREDGNALQADDWELLREICEGDEVLFDVQVALLGVEQQFRGMTRRVGVIDALEKCLKAAIFEDEEEAVEVLTERDKRLKKLKAEEDDQSRQLVLFREDPTDRRTSVARVDQNDSGARDATGLLPLPRRTDLRPHPAARAAQRGHAGDRPVRRRQRRRQDDAARRDPARALRRSRALLEAGRPGVRRVPPQVDSPRCQRERRGGRLARLPVRLRR